VSERELFERSVPSFEMLDLPEEIGIISKRARYGAEPTDVLRVSPPGVVAPAIAV
jgi:hypothetical protein